MASSLLAALRNLLMNIAILSRRRGGGGGPPAPPVVTSIVVTPSSFSVFTGSTRQLSAQSYDQYGSPIADTFTWGSSSAGFATVSGTGLVTGVSAGSPTITATSVSKPAVHGTSAATVQAAPVVTTVVVSPSSFSITTGATQQLTAQSFDQYSNPIADTFTWGSSNAGQATVSGTGLVTGVTAGSPTITATSVTNPAKNGTSAATVTSGGTVTAVSVYYNNAPSTSGLLFFAGSTYQLVAKDQTGSTLSNASGVWSTADGTNMPVNSSGLVSPAANKAGGNVTFTHTASGIAGSAPCTVLKTPGGFMKQDKGQNYANDAAFLANVANYVGVNSSFNSNVPTGTGASLYYDGTNCNQVTIDSTPSRLFMGDRVFCVNIPTTGGTPSLKAIVGGASRRLWHLNVKRFDPGFTLVGTNTGGGSISAAYKDTPWFLWNGVDGRGGQEYTGGSGSGGAIDNGGSVSTPPGGGVLQTHIADLTTEFTGGIYFADVYLYEARAGNIMSHRLWRIFLGTAPSTPLGGVVEGPMNAGASPPSVFSTSMMGENYNQQPPFSNLYKQIGLWQVVDGETYGDPFGLLGTQATPTLTGISGGTVAQSATSAVITLTGTNFNDNCSPIFSNAGILVQSIGAGSYPNTMTVTVNVTAGATTGAGTVAIYNAASQVTTSTQVVTVTSSSVPTLTSATPSSRAQGQTSQNIALVGTNFVSGDTAVFSNAGITVNSTTFNSSTSLTANISVSGGASTGAGTVKVHDATYGDSNTVAFTVTASGVPTDITINFRSTAGFVTDGAGQTYLLNESYPVTRGGITMGLDAATKAGVALVDRNASLDPRLAGVLAQQSLTQCFAQFDLPAGTYDFYATACDTTFGIAQQNFQVYDITAAGNVYTLSNSTSISTSQYEDVSGNAQTISGFPGNWTVKQSFVLTGTGLRIYLGDGSSMNSCALSAVRFVKTA